ncbi:hypothetical protein MTP99_016718 [Tenebrio molitor]|nr:hypothetical protein MTP99_016718 [Tenebrio molitor]
MRLNDDMCIRWRRRCSHRLPPVPQRNARMRRLHDDNPRSGMKRGRSQLHKMNRRNGRSGEPANEKRLAKFLPRGGNGIERFKENATHIFVHR